MSLGITTSNVVPGWIVTVGPVTVRASRRTFCVGAALLVLLLVVSVLTLMHGTLSLTPGEIVNAVFGQGEPRAVRTVQGRRLPRLLTAILVGGALGVAGSVFQSLSRNALASPDVIGFTSGAASGAILQIVVLHGSVLAIALSAIGGGVVTALVVYGLARRDGVTGGVRLVLVGIGVGAVCSAFSNLIVVRADVEEAISAQQWLAGTLIGRGWPHATSVALACAVLLPPLAVLGHRLTLVEMGDDLAGGLGIRAERARFVASVLGVALTGVAVAATGPLAFVALASPQIAARLSRRDGVLVVNSFLLGGLVLALADLLSQSLEVGLRTPVGTLTSLLGGLYLVWLLARRA